MDTVATVTYTFTRSLRKYTTKIEASWLALRMIANYEGMRVLGILPYAQEGAKYAAIARITIMTEKGANSLRTSIQ